MPKEYYHYTDAEGYKTIVENPILGPNREEAVVLLSSNKALSGDAHYGDGWYVTDIPPFGGDRSKIARSLWDGSYKQNFTKTEYFLEFRIHGNTNIKRCGGRKFLIPIGSNPRPILYRHGRVVSRVFPIRFPSSLAKPTAPRRVIFKKRRSDTDWQKQKIDSPEKRNRDSLLQRVKRLLGF